MYTLTLPDEIRTSLTKAALLLEKRDGVMYHRPHVAELMIKMGLESLEAGASRPDGAPSPPVNAPGLPPIGPLPAASTPPHPAPIRGVPTHMVEFGCAHLQVAGDTTPLVELYAHYCVWATAAGHTRITRTKLSKSLVALGFERIRQGYGSAFYCMVVGRPPL